LGFGKSINSKSAEQKSASELAAEVREVGLLFFEFLGLWEIDRFNSYYSLSAIDVMDALQYND
jgi:hypothetical protein